MSPRVLVLAGRGRYEDPWHDHVATSVRVGEILAGMGLAVDVRGAFLASLVQAVDYDLVVVNTGRGRVDPSFDGSDDEWRSAHDGFAAAVRGGLPVLGLHQAANSFADSAHWSTLLGGRWIPGTSYHPPEEECVFDVADPEHPVMAGVAAEFTAYDERYCALDVADDSNVLVTTTCDHVRQPVVWQSGGSPAVIYDGLGHSVRSYESARRRDLLAAEVSWLLS